jgi:hypothetical protein
MPDIFPSTRGLSGPTFIISIPFVACVSLGIFVKSIYVTICFKNTEDEYVRKN